jgi:hypothetical protein
MRMRENQERKDGRGGARAIGLALLAGLITTALLPTPAWAAKLGRIASGSAKVYEKPSTRSRVLGTLSRGTPVATSDRAARGFYRAKAKNGLLGWIEEDDITHNVKAKRGGDDGPGGGSFGGGGVANPISIRAFGGLATLGMKTAVSPAVRDLGLSSGTSLGGEVGYRMNDRLSVLVRVEKLSSSAIARWDLNESPQAETDTEYNITAASTPVMIGAALRMFGETGDRITGDLGGFAGYGLGTRLTAVAANLGGTTEYAAGAPTFLVKANFDFNVATNFMIFGEAGYRVLSKTVASPTTLGAGSGIFDLDPSAGGEDFAEGKLNLGGLLFTVGIGVRF